MRTKHCTKAGCQHRIPQAVSYGSESEVEYEFHERARGGWPLVSDPDSRGSIHTRMCMFGGRSVPQGDTVAQALEPVIAQRGAPWAITVDNLIDVKAFDACSTTTAFS